jgi:hypothetical protein
MEFEYYIVWYGHCTTPCRMTPAFDHPDRFSYLAGRAMTIP